MPADQASTLCCKHFGQKYLQLTNRKYQKSDPAIYSKLYRFGDEKQAIRIAKQKLNNHTKNGQKKPSEMCPATTVHILVEKIRETIDRA